MKKLFAIVLALVLACAGSALADDSELVVSGSGVVQMEADCAYASIGVNLEGEDLASLQKQSNETVNAVYAALLDAGLSEDDISTGHLYVNPLYSYESTYVNKITGYYINHALAIRTSQIDKLGSIIDAAFAAGANSFDSISFGVQNDAEGNKKALQLAVQDAREKAQVLAAAAGKQLGDIVKIVEGGANYAYANTSAVRYSMTEGAAYDMGTTVHAAQVEVNASVQITYELK